VDERAVTVSQRSKEHAHDYRYFPEPDLPPLKLSAAFVEGIRARLPELPAARRERLLELGLSEFEAETLTESRDRADYFDAARAAIGGHEAHGAKVAANWVLSEVLRWCNREGREASQCPVTPERLAGLVGLVDSGAITTQVAKEVFEKMVETGRAAKEIVEEAGLGQISGEDEVLGIVRKVIAANEKAVTDYQAGKEASLKFLIGQVMRETRGRANPQVAQALITSELTK
jgi:aspartyl-tRNA(Asn)/glutamyl-tRNA(Gln) amidotransferase subunit B